MTLSGWRGTGGGREEFTAETPRRRDAKKGHAERTRAGGVGCLHSGWAAEEAEGAEWRCRGGGGLGAGEKRSTPRRRDAKKGHAEHTRAGGVGCLRSGWAAEEAEGAEWCCRGGGGLGAGEKRSTPRRRDAKKGHAERTRAGGVGCSRSGWAAEAAEGAEWRCRGGGGLGAGEKSSPLRRGGAEKGSAESMRGRGGALALGVGRRGGGGR